jgi:CRISPR-associated endonuclease/helicase Cas3
MRQPEQIAEYAIEAARRGAKVIVLRNTVTDCVATQRELERIAGLNAESLLFGCSGQPAPHHSRFARPDRVELDRAVEAKFGKDRPPGGCVLVATQTIQQSLDLDADLLLTDLCPMDVLLQRIGRLHRHRRDRPTDFEQPCCVVLTPDERNLAALIRPDGKAASHHGLGSVYENLCVIEATWRALEARRSISIPSDARALVEESLHSSPIARFVSEGGEAWKRHAQVLLGASRGEQQVAALNLVDWHATPYPECAFPSDGRRISSRLGESDRIVRLPGIQSSPFGREIREFVIPGWLCEDVRAEEVDARDFVTMQGGMIFSFGSKQYRYDRLGLRVEDGAAEGSHGQDDA